MDDERCRICVRSAHATPGERIVVFSQFADSVREIFARLRADGRVAAVTANGAVVAGGRSPGRRSSRGSHRSRRPVAPHHERSAIELLIATDLLSEGLNLQDASVVVHSRPSLDYSAPNAAPWPHLADRLAARAGVRVRDRATGGRRTPPHCAGVDAQGGRGVVGDWRTVPAAPGQPCSVQCDSGAARSNASRRNAAHTDSVLVGFFPRALGGNRFERRAARARTRRSWSPVRERRSMAGSLPSRWAASPSLSRHKARAKRRPFPGAFSKSPAPPRVPDAWPHQRASSA